MESTPSFSGKFLKYKKITIDNVIYIKVLFDGTVSHSTVYTDNFLNATNNGLAFPEVWIFLK